MFTGLIQAKGALIRRTQRGKDARLVFRGALLGGALGKDDPIALGESIAIDGVCLTVDKIVEAGSLSPRGSSSVTESVFEVDASSETLDKTTLGSLPIGHAVNLERALPIGGRLGGHIVSGHVDGVGHVRDRIAMGASVKLVFEAPAELARFIAPKGSIAVSGVSLTINNITGSVFDVMLIPHTLEKTSLDGLAVGDRVNLEVDVLARYVARLMEVGSTSTSNTNGTEPSPDSQLLDRLRASGYV